MKIGLNQFFIYIHPFPPLSSNFFSRFQPSRQKNPILMLKKCWGVDIYPLSPPHYLHLFYEISTLEIVVIFDINLIEPKILIFFIESIISLSVPVPSFLNLLRPVFINTYSLLRFFCLCPTLCSSKHHFRAIVVTQ